MLSRRQAMVGVLACVGGLHSRALPAEPVLTDDGLYRQPWFLESLHELADDLEGATRNGKRFAIMWELKGCPYCKKTHLVNFARPEIETFIKTRFEILQLNIIGLREVTDFDGEKLPERRFAAKYGVRFTPTIQFFPEHVGGLAAKKPREREVARVQGYLEPKDFLAAFQSVAGRAHERGNLHGLSKNAS
jgi:thioredoxin-related protein